jgi:hypothetical protein
MAEPRAIKSQLTKIQAYLAGIAFGTGLASLDSGFVLFRSGQPFPGYLLPDIPGATCPRVVYAAGCFELLLGVLPMNEIFVVAGVASLMMAFLFFVLPTMSMKAR